jgi:large subunit ribosomal protein L18
MKRHTIYTIPYRRARLGKTNYRLRLKLLLSQKPRLVARLSSKNAMAQLITFEPAGDKVVATANSNQLAKLGWKGNKGNLSAAYLVGMLLA